MAGGLPVDSLRSVIGSRMIVIAAACEIDSAWVRHAAGALLAVRVGWRSAYPRMVPPPAALPTRYPAGPEITAAVHPGDRINALISVTGRTCSLSVQNLTTRQTLLSATARCAKRSKCPDGTAEVITEAPGGGPDTGHGLADTRTVMYTYAAAGLSGHSPYAGAIP